MLLTTYLRQVQFSKHKYLTFTKQQTSKRSKARLESNYKASCIQEHTLGITKHINRLDTSIHIRKAMLGPN